jgi:hypothetical protein
MTTSVALSTVGTEILRIVQGSPDWLRTISSVAFVNVGALPVRIFTNFQGRMPSLRSFSFPKTEKKNGGSFEALLFFLRLVQMMAGLPPPGSDVAAILRAQPRPQNWTALEVRRWLEAIELDVYAPIFEAAGVQGADLVSMDADALKRRLGVSHIGHRSKLLKEISILANRAMLSMRRGEEGKTKDFAEKRKDLLDTLYPDRVRRELQAQQHEKLLEARASFWTPDNRKTMGAVEKSAVVNQSKAGGEGRTGVATHSHRKHAEDNIVITEGLARPNMRLEDDQHRTRTWIAHPAQQRAVVRPATGGRQRAPRGGAARPQTAGAGRAADRDETYGMVHENDGEVTTDEAENFITPKQKMQDVAERIKALEASGNYPELIKAWVEYGACVRMEHSDKDKLLVRTHFNLATTYLRQKLVLQALYHFKEADLVNQSNATSDDAISFRCRIMEGKMQGQHNGMQRNASR